MVFPPRGLELRQQAASGGGSLACEKPLGLDPAPPPRPGPNELDSPALAKVEVSRWRGAGTRDESGGPGVTTPGFQPRLCQWLGLGACARHCTRTWRGAGLFMH